MIRHEHVGREIAFAVDEHAQHQGISGNRLNGGDPQIDDADTADNREIRDARRRSRLEEGDVEDETVSGLSPELDEIDAVQRMRRIEQHAGAPLVFALQRAVRR